MKSINGLVAVEGVPQRISRSGGVPGAGEVAIKVHASGVNRADLMQIKGNYPSPAGYSDFLGLECAGVIESVGAGVEGWSEGAPVMALLAAGGFNDRVVCDGRQLLPLPDGWSMEQGAAFVEAYATAWLNLFQLGELKPGERVLLYAGASGVGSAAIQLCKLMGNPVTVVVGSNAKADFCRQLGADHAVLRNSDQCWQQLEALGPFELLLDPVAGDWLQRSLSIMAQDGRLMLIGLMGGSRCQLNAATVLMKRIRIQGSTLRGRSVAFKGKLLDSLRGAVWGGMKEQTIMPVIDRVFEIEEIAAAFEYLASNRNMGKIIVRHGQ
ncbi:NAD(P)H-quinone oxidoreductase [Aestuariirhabdus sp. LZHN29]|uniref:NAD(P)H-quinone oxidoreductase n=1 Tax=Aestuariirhabdus sp. LZHN29 TaxID=3417462 RepID=UPI003CF045D6